MIYIEEILALEDNINIELYSQVTAGATVGNLMVQLNKYSSNIPG